MARQTNGIKERIVCLLYRTVAVAVVVFIRRRRRHLPLSLELRRVYSIHNIFSEEKNSYGLLLHSIWTVCSVHGDGYARLPFHVSPICIKFHRRYDE